MEFLTNPIQWWIEPFTSGGNMATSLWAGIFAVVATSLIGTWVVLRGMSFFGDALAHGVLPGIAIAVMMGFNTTLGAIVAAAAMVVGVSLVRTHSPLPEDASIGVLFVGFLALAVVILSRGSDGGGDPDELHELLFGSVDKITSGDLVREGLAAAIVLGAVVLFYRPFLVMTFDETQAQLLGMRPRLAHAVLLALLAVSIIASFETVGNLLVFAFLIAPPATAILLVRRVPVIMATAVIIGIVSVIVGLLIGYHYETEASASMALVTVAIFLVVLTGRATQRSLTNNAATR